jgi:hypothetical protein
MNTEQRQSLGFFLKANKRDPIMACASTNGMQTNTCHLQGYNSALMFY